MKYFDVAAYRRACSWHDEKAISPKPPKVQTANGTAICLGAMASSNVKIGAKLSQGVVAVLKSLHFALP